MLVPPPPMNFVMECTTTSAPYSIGPQQNRRGHGVINYQRHAVLVRYPGQAFDVRDVPCRIAHALAVNGAGIFVDQLLHIFGAISCRKSRT